MGHPAFGLAVGHLIFGHLVVGRPIDHLDLGLRLNPTIDHLDDHLVCHQIVVDDPG